MAHSPTADDHARALALYLRDGLNAAYSEQLVVSQVRDYNGFANTGEDFPLLCVYRTGSNKELLQRSNMVLAYYLSSFAEQGKLPGIMRWVEVQVANLLEAYSYQDGVCVDLDLSDLRSEYRIGTLGEVAFPYLKIYFALTEPGDP